MDLEIRNESFSDKFSQIKEYVKFGPLTNFERFGYGDAALRLAQFTPCLS